MENAQGSGGAPQGQTIIVSPQARQSNGTGTVGFVLALIALFLGWIPVLGWVVWFLGLILSFVGLFKNPKGLAIAGLVISLIGVALLMTLYAGLLATTGSLLKQLTP